MSHSEMDSLDPSISSSDCKAIVVYQPFLPSLLQRQFERERDTEIQVQQELDRLSVLPKPKVSPPVQFTYTRCAVKTCNRDVSSSSPKSRKKPPTHSIPRRSARHKASVSATEYFEDITENRSKNVNVGNKLPVKRSRVDVVELEDSDEDEEVEEVFVAERRTKFRHQSFTQEPSHRDINFEESNFDEDEDVEDVSVGERRTKCRHQAFTQKPFHKDFFFEESKRRYDELYAGKGFVVEQPFSIDAITVFAILQSNNLENSISISGKFNRTLVSEFYANVGTWIVDEESPFYHKVFVRGVWVRFSPECINELLGSPSDLSAYSPELERPHITPSQVVRKLTDNKVQEWTGSLLPSSRLSATFAVLSRLCKSHWTASSHLSNLTLREAMLMYVLASDEEVVNIGNVIFESIMDRAVENKQTFMSHPFLISRLLSKQSVPSRKSDILQDVPSPITCNKRLTFGKAEVKFKDLPEHGEEGSLPWIRRMKRKVHEALKDSQTMTARLTSLLAELDEHEGDM